LRAQQILLEVAEIPKQDVNNIQRISAYADQNFIISRADNPAWRTAVKDAEANGSVTLVLSPWHFYEFGNANAGRAERLIQFAEEIRSAWILERADSNFKNF
jgi:hypothetical protein